LARVPEFASFVAIDWSGAKGPRQRGIAVAHCTVGRRAPDLVRPGHVWSRQDVLDWILSELPPNTLVGMDLSPSLPFADRGAFFPGWKRSPPNARSLWQLVEEICADDPHLAATSFADHPEASRYFRRHGGRTGDLFGTGAGRFRKVEVRQRQHRLSPYSCMNLIGPAQVGKSSLTGMRVMHRLGGAIPIWPFDQLPPSGSVLVEIYTSLAAREAGLPPGRSKITDRTSLDLALDELDCDRHAPLVRYSDHATDAIMTSAWMRKVAGDPRRWSPKGLHDVTETEGWTFGVT
jgi:hypothetical protein